MKSFYKQYFVVLSMRSYSLWEADT